MRKTDTINVANNAKADALKILGEWANTNTISTTICNAGALKIFGEEFEKHGGLRPVVMATGMHDECPIDDPDHYIELCSQLGEDALMRGITTEDDLVPLIDACLALREQYGHGVWIEGALRDYLRYMKGETYRNAVLDGGDLYERAIAQAGGAMLREMLETC